MQSMSESEEKFTEEEQITLSYEASRIIASICLKALARAQIKETAEA